MRVLIGHNRYLHPGGEDLAFEADAALLERNGHKVTRLETDNTAVAEMAAPVAGMKSIWSKESYRKVSRILEQADFDLAHFHNIFFALSPSVFAACRSHDVPVVVTLHNYRLHCPAGTYFRDGHVCEDCLGKAVPWPSVLHACYRDSRLQSAGLSTILVSHRLKGTWTQSVDRYIALTDFERRKLVEGGLPDEMIEVRGNFVWPDPGRKSGSSEYMLFLGRLAPGKGVELLVRALQWLENIPIVVAGDGPLMEFLETSMNGKYGDQVRVLGQVNHEEAIGLLKRSRALLFPSQAYETFGRVIAEAYACGVPVIGPDSGAAGELIQDGITGLLFRSGDARDLATMISWIWSHQDDAAEMGRQARREYESKYTAERNYEMLMDIYRRAIEDNKAR